MKKFYTTNLRSIVFLLALLMPLSFYGQIFKRTHFQGTFHLNANGGITQYFGDLNKNAYYNSKLGRAAGLFVGYQLSPVIGVRAQVMYGNISSAYAGYGLNARLTDGTVDIVLNISNLTGGEKERLVSFYAFGGAGIVMVKASKTSFSDSRVADLNSNPFVIPVGSGATLALSQLVDLSLEYRQCVVLSDAELDITDRMRQHDYYGYASIGLTYNFELRNNWDLPRKTFFDLFRSN